MRPQDMPSHTKNICCPKPRMLRIVAFVPLTAALLALGCDDRDDVKSYRTAKEAPPPIRASSGSTAPHGSAGVMVWDIPQGWERKPNPNSMRFATLSAGAGEDQIEISITELGAAGGGIRANVDRWRNQIGLGPSTDAEFGQQVAPIENPGASGVMVDLVGPVPEGGESPASRMLAAIFPAQGRTWFIKTTAPAPVMAKHLDGFNALCRSVRFAGQPAVQVPRAAEPARAATKSKNSPAWDLPAGWVQEKQARPMSAASFTIAVGSAEAVVTITPLPGPPKLLSNINRWRGQVGLMPIEDLSDDPPQPIQVAGETGALVDLPGQSKHMLGVIAERDGATWFYKMVGPDPLVAEQKAAFEAFVRSIRFDGGAGK